MIFEFIDLKSTFHLLIYSIILNWTHSSTVHRDTAMYCTCLMTGIMTINIQIVLLVNFLSEMDLDIDIDLFIVHLR